MVRSGSLVTFAVLAMSSSHAFAEQTKFATESQHFVDILGRMEKFYADKPAALASVYAPWSRPFVFVQRDNLDNFLSTNMGCPAHWQCKSEQFHQSQLSVQNGHAPQPFGAPFNLSFKWNLPVSGNLPGPDKSSQILQTQSHLPVSFTGVLPLLRLQTGTIEFTDKAFDKEWLTSLVFLHEGFHLFVQFGPGFSVPSPWKFSTQRVDRDDIFYCRDRKAPENKLEDDSFYRLLRAALKNETSIPALKRLSTDWLRLRSNRYAKIPSVNPLNAAHSTDCRALDTSYEKIEGLADYVAFQALLDLRELKRSDIAWYYEGLYFSPKGPLGSDYAFYPYGAISSFVLDRLDPERNWVLEALSQPDVGLADLVEKYAK
jgi:hypothetical protein